jgi:flagellar motility protein MotE (MotC chaperone)
MATIREKLQAELDTKRQEVASIEQQIATLPAEVENIAEEAWDKIKEFFKAL